MYVLKSEVSRLEAEKELLLRRSQGRITVVGVKDLYERIYDSEDIADKAAARFAMAEMKAGRTPEVE